MMQKFKYVHLHDLQSLPDVILIVKFRRIRRVGNVARVGILVERNWLEDLGVDGIILKCIFKK